MKRPPSLKTEKLGLRHTLNPAASEESTWRIARTVKVLFTAVAVAQC